MQRKSNTQARVLAVSNPLTTPRLSIKQQAAILSAVALTCLVYSNPAAAQALAPITKSSGIIRDTIVGICLTLMTAAWGFAGMKMSFAGATMRDMQGPLLGGTISGGAAAMAAAFIN